MVINVNEDIYSIDNLRASYTQKLRALNNKELNDLINRIYEVSNKLSVNSTLISYKSEDLAELTGQIIDATSEINGYDRKLNKIKSYVDKMEFIADKANSDLTKLFDAISDTYYDELEEGYISEDATDDVLSDKTFKIPDVPSDYLYDVIEYGKSIGLKKNQFDYDDDTETLIITYSPYDKFGYEKCADVYNTFIKMRDDEDFDECYKTESLSDKKNGEYLHYIVKITPYKDMFKFDLDNQHFDKQSYCFFDKNGKYVDTNYKSVSEKEFNKFYDKSMKPNKAYGFYYTKPFGEFLGFEEVPLRWFGV